MLNDQDVQQRVGQGRCPLTAIGHGDDHQTPVVLAAIASGSSGG
jgi:hypothetical protein